MTDKKTNNYLSRTLAGIKQRCLNEHCTHYHNYGGRGIKLHKQWEDDSKAFKDYILKELGERPKGCTLDRVNNEEGYKPGNLRWATAKEQANNKRNNLYVDVEGAAVPVAIRAKQLGLTYSEMKRKKERDEVDFLYLLSYHLR